jgi:2-polyprenyl-3-methyl-5-hydroxy-6-metoxy-1,4-benzoquinol methylase
MDIDNINAGIIITACLLLTFAALITRLRLPKNRFSKFFKPDTLTEPLFNRVLVLNIDGVRKDIFDSLQLPTISWLKKNGTYHESGLKTVYRALTNPAFASIFTGTAPEIHGVRDNNFGQSIKTEGLPDIVPTIAYGSMHVKHFCKKYWETKIVSLPRHSVYQSDEIALEWMKQDILERDDVRLFVFDFSEADFLAHAYGSTSNNYKQALSRTDQRIGNLLNWIDEKNKLDDTAVIVCSDHGIAGIDHSYLLAHSERYVPFFLYGKGIKKGFSLRRKGNIMDICNTISYLLGVRYPYDSRGQVFLEALENEKFHEVTEELVERFNTTKYGLEADHYRTKHTEIFQGDVRWWKSTIGASVTPKQEGLRILDIGCGTGFVAEQFLDAGVPIKTFVCQDVSSEMLDQAQKTIGFQPGFEYITDLDEAQGPFDIITASSVFHHIPDVKKMANRIDSLLIKGGLVFGSHEPNKNIFNNKLFLLAASLYKSAGGGMGLTQEFVAGFNQDLKKKFPGAPRVSQEEILQMVEFHSPLEQYDNGIDINTGFKPHLFFTDYFPDYTVVKVETYTTFYHRLWLEQHKITQKLLDYLYRTFFRQGNLFRFVIQKF